MKIPRRSTPAHPLRRTAVWFPPRLVSLSVRLLPGLLHGSPRCLSDGKSRSRRHRHAHRHRQRLRRLAPARNDRPASPTTSTRCDQGERLADHQFNEPRGHRRHPVRREHLHRAPRDRGVEQAASAGYTLPANAATQQYCASRSSSPPAARSTAAATPTSPTTAAPATSMATANTRSSSNGIHQRAGQRQRRLHRPTILDAYKLNGTRLWRINLGLNIRSGAH